MILVAETAVSAQFQCGLQLKDGDSITISQQYVCPPHNYHRVPVFFLYYNCRYVATQSRCTINGPAVGTATITSLVTDTQVASPRRLLNSIFIIVIVASRVLTVGVCYS